MTAWTTSVRQKVDGEGQCRMCERRWAVRRPTRHRLVPGRCGGRYETVNVVPLCRVCHDAVESDVLARRLLRPRLGQAEVAHAIARMGKPWLDRTYPLRGLDEGRVDAILTA